MPYFSTIIPAFNRGSLIRATLDSALSQSKDDDQLQEIIVVDDGSTDDTPEILKHYQATYPRQMRTIRQANAGPGEARNHGVREAKGRYLCFLDSDDLWFPWTLKMYRSIIMEHHEPSFLLATAVPFKDEVALLQRVHETEPVADEFADFFSTSAIGFWHGCSAVVVRADRFRATDGFTQQNINAEDTDLWMQFGVAPSFVHLRSPATVGYREHPTSAVANMTKTRDGMLHLIEQERAGKYPGGQSRRSERLTMLTRHLRAASMHCLAANQIKDAWMLYRASFAWNAGQGRIKYLLGFPAAAALHLPGETRA